MHLLGVCIFPDLYGLRQAQKVLRRQGVDFLQLLQIDKSKGPNLLGALCEYPHTSVGGSTSKALSVGGSTLNALSVGGSTSKAVCSHL